MKEKKGVPISKVLVFEKQFIVGLDLKRSLSEKGYKVYFESQLAEARELISVERPDFVIACASSIGELLPGMQKDGKAQKVEMSILDRELKILTVFQKPFHSELLVAYLGDHLKQPG